MLHPKLKKLIIKSAKLNHLHVEKLSLLEYLDVSDNHFYCEDSTFPKSLMTFKMNNCNDSQFIMKCEGLNIVEAHKNAFTFVILTCN